MTATLRSILAGSEVNLFRAFLQEVITREIGTRIDDPPGSGAVRVQFVASQLVGVAMARYVIELEPFASLPIRADRRDDRTEPAALPHWGSASLARAMS